MTDIAAPLPDLRYPLGPFAYQPARTHAERTAWIDVIAATPAKLRAAVAGLDPEQLDAPYRPGGWTVRQVVHHVPDSHMNAYIRCKLTLTEDHPTIKPYDEARWAELPDSTRPIEGSLALVDWLHERWVSLLRATPEAAFVRTCHHPEAKIDFTLDRLVAMYAWHGPHHVAHVTELRRRERW
jgi:uncharacterized damage-inducible protein DinB